jgi:uncharacterized membrane protein
MATIRETIEVAVPVQTAYNQWTQFEQFPSFMEGVEFVKQLDDTHLHWVADVGGQKVEWDAEITHQEPDRRIAWRATSGKPNSGDVTFQPVEADKTRIDVEMEYEAEGAKESAGGTLGFDSRRVKSDLERFKDFIEGRGTETGAWRGKVEGGEVTRR